MDWGFFSSLLRAQMQPRPSLTLPTLAVTQTDTRLPRLTGLFRPLCSFYNQHNKFDLYINMHPMNQELSILSSSYIIWQVYIYKWQLPSGAHALRHLGWIASHCVCVCVCSSQSVCLPVCLNFLLLCLVLFFLTRSIYFFLCYIRQYQCITCSPLVTMPIYIIMSKLCWKIV